MKLVNFLTKNDFWREESGFWAGVTGSIASRVQRVTAFAEDDVTRHLPRR